MIIVITYPIVYRFTYICATHVYMFVYVGCKAPTSCEYGNMCVCACMYAFVRVCSRSYFAGR